MNRLIHSMLVFGLLTTSSVALADQRSLECREVGPAGEVLGQFTLQNGAQQVLNNGSQAELIIERRNAVLSVRLASGSTFSVSRPGRFSRDAFLQLSLPDSTVLRCERAR